MRLHKIVSNLDSVERMALRAYIDHGRLPKLQVLRALIGKRLIRPGPAFGLCAGVAEAVAAWEREQRRVHLLNAEQLERAIRARRDPVIL